MKDITPEVVEKFEKIARLVAKCYKKTITTSEYEKLSELMGDSPDRIKLLQEMIDPKNLEKQLGSTFK